MIVCVRYLSSCRAEKIFVFNLFCSVLSSPTMSIYVSRANKRGGSSSPVTPNSTMVSTSSSVEEVKAKLNFRCVVVGGA